MLGGADAITDSRVLAPMCAKLVGEDLPRSLGIAKCHTSRSLRDESQDQPASFKVITEFNSFATSRAPVGAIDLGAN